VTRKKEYPPLLAVGFHQMSIAQLRGLCVTPFAKSNTRSPIMDGLEKIVVLIRAKGIEGELWIDGSFLTEKLHPKDSDVVLQIQHDFRKRATPEQVQFIKWFGTADLKPAYLCDSHYFYQYPDGHALYGEGEWDRAYWIKQFGYSRGEDYKGLSRLKLP